MNNLQLTKYMIESAQYTVYMGKYASTSFALSAYSYTFLARNRYMQYLNTALVYCRFFPHFSDTNITNSHKNEK